MRRRATASHWELQERSASVPGRCSPIPGRAHQARWTVRPWNRCGLELPGGGGVPGRWSCIGRFLVCPPWFIRAMTFGDRPRRLPGVAEPTGLVTAGFSSRWNGASAEGVPPTGRHPFRAQAVPYGGDSAAEQGGWPACGPGRAGRLCRPAAGDTCRLRVRGGPRPIASGCCSGFSRCLAREVGIRLPTRVRIAWRNSLKLLAHEAGRGRRVFRDGFLRGHPVPAGGGSVVATPGGIRIRLGFQAAESGVLRRPTPHGRGGSDPRDKEARRVGRERVRC